MNEHAAIAVRRKNSENMRMSVAANDDISNQHSGLNQPTFPSRILYESLPYKILE